jgi:hypothetical protein
MPLLPEIIVLFDSLRLTLSYGRSTVEVIDFGIRGETMQTADSKGSRISP